MIWHVFAASSRLFDGTKNINQDAVDLVMKHHVKVYYDPTHGGGIWWCVPKPLGWVFRAMHLAEHWWRHKTERLAFWHARKIGAEEGLRIPLQILIWYGPVSLFLEWALNFDRRWVREVNVREDDGKFSVVK